MKRTKLGDILMDMGAIDEYQVRSALEHQRAWGKPFGQVVIDKGFCAPEQVMAALSKQIGMPLVDLDRERLDERLAPLLSRKVAEQHRVIPLRVEGKREEVLVVAIAAPATLASIDAVQSVSRKARVIAFLASDAAIERAIGRIYLGYARAETQKVEGRNDPKQLMMKNEVELELDSGMDPGREAEARPVLLYGWTEDAGRNLALVLAAEGIAVRVASAFEVLSCDAADVVVAPLPAMETLLPKGQRCRGRFVAAGKVPEVDLYRAQKLGAKGFLAAPIDSGLLLRAVRRCKASPIAEAVAAA